MACLAGRWQVQQGRATGGMEGLMDWREMVTTGPEDAHSCTQLDCFKRAFSTLYHFPHSTNFARKSRWEQSLPSGHRRVCIEQLMRSVPATSAAFASLSLFFARL